MLQLHKIFVLVRFFNQISCNKRLKGNISCFFTFFLFNPPETGMFQKQKDCFVPEVTQAEEIQKSASMELHEWSENMVNVQNCQFLKENCWFLSVIRATRKQSVCSITLLYSCTFYSLFLPFFVLEIIKSNMTRGSSDILLLFPNLNDLNSCGEHPCQSASSIKLQTNIIEPCTSTWVFYCKFATYFQNTSS